jgi:hypothetical protein
VKPPRRRALSEHLATTDGNTIFRHACRVGLEGIVAKWRDRPRRGLSNRLAYPVGLGGLDATARVHRGWDILLVIFTRRRAIEVRSHCL